MSNKNTLLQNDMSLRLDTGMTVREAVDRTIQWWAKTGRRQMIEMREHQAGTKGKFRLLDANDDNYIPSGIVNGLEWSALNKREKLMVIKHWHHFYVRNKDIIGTEEHQYKFGQRTTIQ